MQSLSSFMNTIRFNFLYIDKYSFGRTWIYPESAIPYNMLRYVIDGSAEFMVDDESVIVKRARFLTYPRDAGFPAGPWRIRFPFTASALPPPYFMRGPTSSGNTIISPW